MARNFRNQPRGSGLFAFQDVITAVIGIFLLMILLLIVSINNVVPALGSTTGGVSGFLPEATEATQPELQSRLDDLIRQLAAINDGNRRLQRTLADAQSAGDVDLLAGVVADLRQQLAEVESESSRLSKDLDEAAVREQQRATELGMTDLQDRVGALRQGIVQKRHLLQEMGQQISKLERQVRLAQSQVLEELQNADHIWVIPEPTDSTKEPVVFVISSSQVTRHLFNRPGDDFSFSSSRLRDGFQDAVDGLRHLDHYLVFFFRPSGIAHFESILGMARSQGFEIGYDAIDEDLIVTFSSRRKQK